MNKKITVLVVDGQGGGMGKSIITALKGKSNDVVIKAVGTNPFATSAMQKAGADSAYVGETAIIRESSQADVITGPLGIVAVNALKGEITVKIAEAIGKSQAKKILIPLNKCSLTVCGVESKKISELVDLAVKMILNEIERLTEIKE